MSEKVIYCSIPPRKKIVKFVPRENVPDREVIKKKLIEASKCDDLLRQTFLGHSIVLQSMDSFLKEWVDIEEFDKIPDRAEVMVVLVPNVKNFDSIKIGETVDLQLNVLSDTDVHMESNQNKSESNNSQINNVHSEDTQLVTAVHTSEKSSADQEKVRDLKFF